ncbi:NAD-dependent epimerase/dehydratase family protein [Pelagibius litoralis]|uniref:NAD-dependent epimerase/dehydratase family protein n=1 Tax=Pelagibius litoralis TaxID=374515 RepID=A0A967KFV3_9PROT|nr:hopanoid-associated sugar epimerase [Pelagibius litoralis]NIA69841.1 NAD-dependent epimerase/dehydratase family protein [Pelagibius litoralis]
MTTLVTGGTGFVGSAVVRALIARGERPRCLVRRSGDRRNLDGLAVDLVEGDLTDADSLEAALRNCSTLFHVAADYRIWVRDPAAMNRANVEGTKQLMQAALRQGVGRVVYTSSVAVLGKVAGGAPADEDTPVGLDDMIGVYKRSKFLAEEQVRGMQRDAGLPVVIVNPSTPIGPRDVKPTPTGRLVVEAAAGRVPAFVDTGLNVVHVDDVAAGHLLAYDKGVIGERYLLGGENLGLSEILSVVAALRGRRAPKIRLPRRPLLPFAHLAEAWARVSGGKDPMLTVDGLKMAAKPMYFRHDKAARDLGYQPRPAHEAIREAVEWFEREGYLG